MKTMNEKKWLDAFILELRLREVRGEAIGDAAASVKELRSHKGYFLYSKRKGNNLYTRAFWLWKDYHTPVYRWLY